MTKTIRGRLAGGKIELLEPIDAPDGTEVDVSYEPRSDPIDAQPMRIYRGMFAKLGMPLTTEADWDEAKAMWEPKEP